jgi:hypothetical protein
MKGTASRRTGVPEWRMGRRRLLVRGALAGAA